MNLTKFNYKANGYQLDAMETDLEELRDGFVTAKACVCIYNKDEGIVFYHTYQFRSELEYNEDGLNIANSAYDKAARFAAKIEAKGVINLTLWDTRSPCGGSW